MQTSSRQWPVDLAKVVASNLIVLHHFSAYGPLSDALFASAQTLASWLYDYARMAVQVFLVLGGFLAAKAWAPDGRLRARTPWQAILQRYLRLAPPFLVAMLLTTLVAAGVRSWMDADYLPAPSTAGQWLAHAALLHGITGVESLSAGVWYVAIDFQLFSLLLCLLWLGGRKGVALVLAMTLASMLYFNLRSEGDNWAPYFFAAYGLGASAWWASRSKHWPLWLLGCGVAVLLALAWDYRTRLALATCTALFVFAAQRWSQRGADSGRLLADGPGQVLRLLGRSSYALFLVHFAVLMLANAWYAHAGHTSTTAAWLTVAAAWVLCQALAWGFERWVERPLARLRL